MFQEARGLCGASGPPAVGRQASPEQDLFGVKGKSGTSVDRDGHEGKQRSWRVSTGLPSPARAGLLRQPAHTCARLSVRPARGSPMEPGLSF